MNDKVSEIGRWEKVKVFRKNIPVHCTIHDLFPNLDRVVFAIDFGQRWDASHGLPEKAISHRQDV